MTDSEFMNIALACATEAAAAGEVPIGAVAVVDGQVLATARNRVEECKSVTAHAEIELLRQLERLRGDWRMEDVTIYVTKEPCPMCAGALVNARVRRIVYGLTDPRFGGCSVFGITSHPESLWHPEVTSGVGEEESKELITKFFRHTRSAKSRSEKV
ncbi:MAG: nucleoside deaminase [Victivallales bacterium]|jgi:tRNA(adenine34) deaminase|nr:nucleoside deaminase [Victivallales bacterium]